MGRLVTAKRWDAASLDVSSTTDPVGVADVELHYGYDASDMRVSKRAVDTQGEESNTLYIFGSLELRRTIWDTQTQDYALNPQTEVAYLFANGVRLARLAYEEPGDVPSINGENLHVFFELGDHLGSTSVVLDKATSELVERSTYQAYGGSESDYRPERWKHFREDYRFTGKEEDVEVGLIYFGFRFLNPLLNRWVSADPLALVAWDQTDPNLYAYVSGHTLRSIDPLGLQETPHQEPPKIAPRPKGLPPTTKAPGTPRPTPQPPPSPKKIEFPSTGTGVKWRLPPPNPIRVFFFVWLSSNSTASNDQQEINAKGIPKKYYNRHRARNTPAWENSNVVRIEHYDDGSWRYKFRIKRPDGTEREFWVRYNKKGRLEDSSHVHKDRGVQYVPVGKSREADYAAANRERGKAQPRGYVWHHAGLEKRKGKLYYRMELWDEEVHGSTSHDGAYSDPEAKKLRGEDQEKAAPRRRPPKESK